MSRPPSRAPSGRTGRAELPLHGGRVPMWLATRMASLGAVITQAIVLEYGQKEFLRRVSHPFWFQSFGAVMGMDWHSSGMTTSVLGALKRGLGPLEGELGLKVCGGRGKHSRKTPGELRQWGETTGVDGKALAAQSRLIAKVDSAAVQDGYELYLHGMIVNQEGDFTVIQQGMNGAVGMARRYHWLSEGVEDFVVEPHSAIDGEPGGEIVNLSDRRAEASRAAQLAMLNEDPSWVVAQAAKLIRKPQPQTLPLLQLPAHHDVRGSDVVLRRLHGRLAAVKTAGVESFADLLSQPGIGPRTIFALSLVAEVVYGAPSRFSDPARFSMAHGGKDGHPFPVPLKVFDRSIAVMKHAVSQAKLGQRDRLSALENLDTQARALEAYIESGPSVEGFISKERARSSAYGGRRVFGFAGAPAKSALRAHGAPPGPKRARRPQRSSSKQRRLPLSAKPKGRKGPR